MNTVALLFKRYLTSALLLLGCLFGLGGVRLFTNVYYGGSSFLPAYLTWERSLIAAAAFALLLGFAGLAATLRAAGERLFSWIGLGALALGTVLTVLFEWRAITTGQEELGWTPLHIGAFVALIFVGQTAYGAALLQRELLPGWVGWLLIIWNLAWLAVVAVFSARDPYYPVLFYVCPLVLGLFLFSSVRSGSARAAATTDDVAPPGRGAAR
jgi:hypothetical protein